MKHKHEHEKRKAHDKTAGLQVPQRVCPGFNGPCVISAREYRELAEERAEYKTELKVALVTIGLLNEAADKNKKEIAALKDELGAANKAIAEAKDSAKMYQDLYYRERAETHKLHEKLAQLDATYDGQVEETTHVE